MTNLPVYIWLLTAAGALIMPTLLGWALYQGARAAGSRRLAATLVGAGASVLVLAWVGTSAGLAAGGVYRGTLHGLAPLTAATGTLIALLALSRLPAVRRAVADRNAPARLALVQTARILGVVFVLVLLLGRLPAVFALPAGLGDMAIGVTAPFVAIALWRRGATSHAGVEFNLLGILDLVVAVSIAFIVRRVGITPSAAPLASLPLAVIPTAFVPLAITLHLVSLERLYVWRHTQVPTLERGVAL